MKFNRGILFCTLFVLISTSSIFVVGQGNNSCSNVTQLPNFVRNLNAVEWQQVYQEINIRRIDRNLAAYGYNVNLRNAAIIIANQLTATNSDLEIAESNINVQSPQFQTLLAPYIWDDGDQLPIVDSTRSVHRLGSDSVDQIVNDLFGNASMNGVVQSNSRDLLQNTRYREIGIAVASRPATQEKVVVIVLGSRRNVYPLVINFGGNMITSLPVLLSFHNEQVLPQGDVNNGTMGNIFNISLTNNRTNEVGDPFIWTRFCNYLPSQSEGELDLNITYTDINNLQSNARAGDWMPSGSPTINLALPAVVATEELVVATEAPVVAIEEIPTCNNSIASPEIDNRNVSMVCIPGGIFARGWEQGESDEIPVRNIDISPFYMDVYEVTNESYSTCVNQRFCEPPSQVDTRNEHPVAWVTWEQANIYCQAWRGGRLPTEAEWEFVARHNPNTNRTETHPWGSFGATSDLANFDSDSTQPVGSYPQGRSIYGVYDLGGNVFEWVGDWYSSNYYSSSPNQNPTGPLSSIDAYDLRVIRGGAYNYPSYYTRGANRDYSSERAAQPYIGFRCAKDIINFP
ncbi:MAG: hypothetical protein Phog2KO_24870 [Phototrophicaceae bacterium]